ncbi:MAG: hypothetical protein JJU23_15190, partial [Cyclobacteriaceae bacterium]|nr:hypothetical protein [Cyclobacteriaceae bacterium]
DLSYYFGEMLADPAVRQELLATATEETDEEIFLNLTNLFKEQDGYGGKQAARMSGSAIVKSFYENADKYHKEEQASGDFDLEFFIDFIQNNNVEVYAPYLYEMHDLENLTEITLTYFSEDMHDDPNFEGTPGYVMDITNLELLGFRKNTLADSFREIGMVTTNDDYAVENPTMVISAGLDYAILDPGFGGDSGGYAGGGGSGSGGGSSNNYDLTWDCSDYENYPNRLQINMPMVKLKDNFHSWPRTNRIQIYAAWADEFSFDIENNTIPIGYRSRRHLPNYRIRRTHVDNNRWRDISSYGDLVYNFPANAKDLAIIVTHRLETATITEVEVSLGGGSIGPKGIEVPEYLNTTIDFDESWNYHSHRSPDLCNLIVDQHQTNMGNSHNGLPRYEIGLTSILLEIQQR